MKLAQRFIGPFRVLERIGPVAYHLELSANLKIHPTFHVSHLKPYTDPASFSPDRPHDYRPPPIQVDGDDEYEVEAILDRRTRRRRLEYLIKWLSYPDSENTWEPAANLSHAQDLLLAYDTAHP